MGSEQEARKAINRMLIAVSWAVQEFNAADIHVARGVAIREFLLDAGQGFVDALIYINSRAASVIEANKQGAAFASTGMQSMKISRGNHRRLTYGSV